MRAIVTDYRNNHNVLCYIAGCRNRATHDVSNAVGDRRRACADHLGDAVQVVAILLDPDYLNA